MGGLESQGIVSTRAPAAVVLVRLMVGCVFLSEGIQKFVFPDQLGAGRFAKIGLPAPDVLGPVVGGVEIAAGALVIVGLLIRPAALALWIVISVALVSTKVPMLLGHEFWIFSLRKLSHYGFWSMAHQVRTDFCMWMGRLFLLVVGAGRASLDAALAPRQDHA